MGQQSCFWHTFSKAVGFWFLPDIHIAVGFCNCPLPPHLPHSQLSSCPMWSRVVFEATMWDNLLGKQTQLLTVREIGTLTGLCACQSHKEAVNQLCPANQKQELNEPLIRSPKEDARTVPINTREGVTCSREFPEGWYHQGHRWDKTMLEAEPTSTTNW